MKHIYYKRFYLNSAKNHHKLTIIVTSLNSSASKKGKGFSGLFGRCGFLCFPFRFGSAPFKDGGSEDFLGDSISDIAVTFTNMLRIRYKFVKVTNMIHVVITNLCSLLTKDNCSPFNTVL